MHGEFAAEFVTAAGGFDRIDVADQIGNRHIWRSKFFDVAIFRRKIVDLRGVAAFVDQVATRAAERRVGIVVDLASCDIGQLRIEQTSERSQNAALCLTAQSEQDEIVPRKHGIDDLRNHGVFVAYDSGEHCFFSAAQTRDQVLAQFIFHTTGTQTRLRIGASA